MATVVVLNGTSSSGKTTIARAFQEAAPRRFLNFSIDSILLTLPPRDIERITGGGELSDLNLPGLVRAYYACVRELLALGHDLVIDHAITTLFQAEQLALAVAGHTVVTVGLHCDPDVLLDRERKRGDRRAGMAVQQLEGIHRWLQYDIEIDTGTVPADMAARAIVDTLAKVSAT